MLLPDFDAAAFTYQAYFERAATQAIISVVSEHAVAGISVNASAFDANGDATVAGGETQAHWRHALPRTKRPVGARINLTFRRIGCDF